MSETKLLPFEKKVLDTLHKFNMPGAEGKSKILAGFSGGADSTALVLALCAVFGHDANARLACVHVNHMIRGNEADRDEAFVRNFCKDRGLEFFCERIDIPALAKKCGKGVEETARNERYAFFNRLCKQHGYDFIATAHTASDNAETVIFNLARGAGLDGLCGIPPVRDNIIRPLILCTRDEVEHYLASVRQSYVTDSTNLCDDYTRNSIRHTVIPNLKRINPSLENTISNSCAIMRQDRDFIGKASEKAYKKSVLDGFIGKEIFTASSPSIASRVVRSFYCEKTGAELSGSKIKELLRVADEFFNGKNCDGIREKYVSLGGEDNLFALISDKGVELVNKKKDTNASDFDFFLKSGENICGENYVILAGNEYADGFQHIFTDKNQISYKILFNYSLFSDRIVGKVTVRNRREGDAYAWSGHTRKLKKVFSDMKIPLMQRDEIPLICDDNGIIFTAATPLADRHRAYDGKTGDFPIAIYKRHQEE